MDTLKLYNINFMPEAFLELEDIRRYIAYNLQNPFDAEKHYDDILKAAYGLKIFPNRGTLLRNNLYAKRDYRKIFVHNYTIIYYVEGDTVYIVDVLYSSSDIESKFETK